MDTEESKFGIISVKTTVCSPVTGLIIDVDDKLGRADDRAMEGATLALSHLGLGAIDIYLKVSVSKEGINPVCDFGIRKLII